MKKALLIHGWFALKDCQDPATPTPSSAHWFPWLSKQLMVNNIHTVAIEMPNAFNPQYNEWKSEFERYDLNEDTILIAHSLGCGFLTRYISDNDVSVGKVIFVAPWIGVSQPTESNGFDRAFSEYTVDKNLIKKTAGITIIESTNDMLSIGESVEYLMKNVADIKRIILKNKGHFRSEDLGTDEFPELLEEIKC